MAKQKYVYVTSTLMRQFILSLLSLCRQDLFEVFFPGTVSSTLYPFQELVCFMIVYSFQNLFLFRKYILFRNCFCQTNPFQEWSSQKLSFDVSFEQKNYWIPIKSVVSYHPFSGTVMSDTTLFEAHRIPSSFRSCHFWHCLFQDGSISNPLQKSF